MTTLLYHDYKLYTDSSAMQGNRMGYCVTKACGKATPVYLDGRPILLIASTGEFYSEVEIIAFVIDFFSRYLDAPTWFHSERTFNLSREGSERKVSENFEKGFIISADSAWTTEKGSDTLTQVMPAHYTVMGSGENYALGLCLAGFTPLDRIMEQVRIFDNLTSQDTYVYHQVQLVSFSEFQDTGEEFSDRLSLTPKPVLVDPPAKKPSRARKGVKAC